MEATSVARYVCSDCARALRTARQLRPSVGTVRHPRSARPFSTSIPPIRRHTFTTAARPTLRASDSLQLHAPVQSWSRTFTAAASCRSRAVQNPRHDEDGNEMSVEITPRAAHRLAQIMAKEDSPDVALRVTVESGGCHGFQYLMSLIKMSEVDQHDDTVFEGDKGARVVMDEPSLDLLKGSKVDYTMELIGSQFKITDNPLATSSCGCGTSFDIKAT